MIYKYVAPRLAVQRKKALSMSWPLSQDYNEAIQSPASSFADPELRAGQPVVNALGMPMPRSGNFADVYQFEGAHGERWALKCFTREIPRLQERYSEISKFLAQAKLPFTVDLHYLAQGIRIRGQWYPVLKMQWVEGLLLNEFVRANLAKPALLEALGQIWQRMARRLREAGLAHADLQHGNIILVPSSRANALAARLIDYDGMWVPALARGESGEIGHANYQHPQRVLAASYNAEVDRFPLLAIACALRCLALGGAPLWQRYDNGDNLLFREVDFRKPADSPLFKELWNLPDAGAHDLVGHLTLAVAGPLDKVPLLQELFVDNRVTPLTLAQEAQVTAILGPGAPFPRPPHAPIEAAGQRAPESSGSPLALWLLAAASGAVAVGFLIAVVAGSMRSSAEPAVEPFAQVEEEKPRGENRADDVPSESPEEPTVPAQALRKPGPAASAYGVALKPASAKGVSIAAFKPATSAAPAPLQTVIAPPPRVLVNRPLTPFTVSGLPGVETAEFDCSGEPRQLTLKRGFQFANSWELSLELQSDPRPGPPGGAFVCGDAAAGIPIFVRQRGSVLEAGIGKAGKVFPLRCDLDPSRQWHKVVLCWDAVLQELALYVDDYLIRKEISPIVPGAGPNPVPYVGQDFKGKVRNLRLGNW
jgi:hypothetical protein